MSKKALLYVRGYSVYLGESVAYHVGLLLADNDGC